MEIVTKSHIDQKHADSQHFPMAESADGLFHWHSGLHGYVAINCALSGLPPNTGDGLSHSVYLQYGSLDTAVSPELLAQAREFSREVSRLQELREQEASRRESEAEEQAAEARRAVGIAAAAKTGKDQVIAQWMADCDGTAFDCSFDSVAEMVRPNGTTYYKRVHCF